MKHVRLCLSCFDKLWVEWRAMQYRSNRFECVCGGIPTVGGENNRVLLPFHSRNKKEQDTSRVYVWGKSSAGCPDTGNHGLFLLSSVVHDRAILESDLQEGRSHAVLVVPDTRQSILISVTSLHQRQRIVKCVQGTIIIIRDWSMRAFEV